MKNSVFLSFCIVFVALTYFTSFSFGRSNWKAYRADIESNSWQVYSVNNEEDTLTPVLLLASIPSGDTVHFSTFVPTDNYHIAVSHADQFALVSFELAIGGRVYVMNGNIIQTYFIEFIKTQPSGTRLFCLAKIRDAEGMLRMIEVEWIVN
jgi:hypothetical protein